jgi:ABC-type antimicrobial peptide transport system permease subunit
LSSGIEPFIFRYQPDQFYFNMFVKIDGSQISSALASIEKSYRKLDKDTQCDIRFLDDSIQQTYMADKRLADLVLLFGLLTLIVGSMGLFGLTVFATEQRVKEIGIRKVLGAGIAQITFLLSKDFVRLVTISLLIAIPLAWYATSQWLQQFSFRIHPQWWLYASGGLVVMLLAIATICIQSLRAAKANPADSLRNE